MQPAFHRQRIAAMGETMVNTTLAALDGWKADEMRDVSQEMIELTMQVVGRTLFGTEVGEDLSRIRATNRVFVEHFRSRLFTMMILLPDRFPSPGNRRYRRAVGDLERLVYRIIGERRASGDDGAGTHDFFTAWPPNSLRSAAITLPLKVSG